MEKINFILLVLVFGSIDLHAQKTITLEEAWQRMETHPRHQAAMLHVNAQGELRKTVAELPRTNVGLQYGQYNSFNRDNNFTITQTIPYPGVIVTRKWLQQSRIKEANYNEALVLAQLHRDLRILFYELAYAQQRLRLLEKDDSLMQSLQGKAFSSYKAGEFSLIDYTLMETRASEAHKNLLAAKSDFSSRLDALRIMLDDTQISGIVEPDLEVRPSKDTADVSTNPALLLYRTRRQTADYELKHTRRMLFPDFTIGYFNQTLIGFQNPDGTERYADRSTRFSGFIAGLAIPLSFRADQARIKAASLAANAWQMEVQGYERELHQQLVTLRGNLEQASQRIAYYRDHALHQANLLQTQSLKRLMAGEASASEFAVVHREIITIREGYVKAVLDFRNLTAELDFLTGRIDLNR